MNALPYAGGLFDQPPSVLFRMEAVLMASAQPETAKANLEAAREKVDERIDGVRRT